MMPGVPYAVLCPSVSFGRERPGGQLSAAACR